MQIHKSTVYEGCSISLQPKVEADVLNNCNVARVQIYSIDEYTESLKLQTCLIFLLQIIKHNYPSRPSNWKKNYKVRHRAVIPYLGLEGKTPKQVYQDMEATLGEDALSYSMVKKWVGKFKRGRESLKDNCGP